MQGQCDLKVHINGHHTFHLHQKVISSFSGRLKRLVKQERKRSKSKCSVLKLMEFPGGPEGFELVSRFCYNNGRVAMTTSNICILNCAAVLLEMTEEVATCNLLQQTEMFMENMYYWTWNEVVVALKSCEPFFAIAETSGLVNKLISSLLAKVSANSEIPIASTVSLHSSSSSSSSPDTFGVLRNSSSTKTPEPMKPCINKEWWFDDLTLLAPNIIEKFMKALGAYGNDNKNLILTRFLLHYLKAAVQRPGNIEYYKEEYSGLADTAVHGVVLVGRAAFSCRGLFWVLRVVSCFGFSKECRHKLEKLMGLMLDQATLDDLLVSGGHDGGDVYDVNLVLRLVRIFVTIESSASEVLPAQKMNQRMKKVGRLIDKYLGEISPDQGLKVCKFLAVAESLPDSARDCFDGVFRALDIYLESHPSLTTEERTTLCRCLNYEKLTLEACKDLAKNKRIPPTVAVQALVSQQAKLQIKNDNTHKLDPAKTPQRLARASPSETESASPSLVDEKEELKINLQRMQSRVIELEKVCRDMKGQMTKMSKNKSFNNTSRGLSRLC